MTKEALGGKTIIITGASSGIGEATALELGRFSTKLVLVARRQALLEQAAERVRAAGSQALVAPADLAQIGQIASIVPETLEHFGRVDALLNIAGWGSYSWLDRMDPNDIDMQFRVNVLGMVYLTQAVIPVMRRQGAGHIVNMSSYASKVATPVLSMYASTKYAIEGFSDALRRELLPEGIHVSRVHPGGVRDTEFNQKASQRGGVQFDSPSIGSVSKQHAARRLRRLLERPTPEIYIGRLYDIPRLINNLWPGLVDFVLAKWVQQKRRLP
jgi:short-subunit dehydrogenase